MKKEISVVIDDHPYSREYNKFGCPVDIKIHNWTHVNVKFICKPSQYDAILKAFSTARPFELLGWHIEESCLTKTISRWTVRESPVANQEGDSLWLSFECLNGIPEAFLQYLASKFGIKIRASYCPPYRAGKWLTKIFEPN